jgi:hypothetical protein
MSEVNTDTTPGWAGDLSVLLDGDGCRFVLSSLIDVLTYRDVTRDDVRDAVAAWQRITSVSVAVDD